MNFAAQFLSLLKQTTNSYKYLFLRSLIKRVGQGETVILIDDIILDMLVDAWYPSQYFRLSLGLQDQIGGIFKKQSFQYSSSVPVTSEMFKERLKLEIGSKVDKSLIKSTLSKYVQYRILSSFFKDELSGKKDVLKNNLIFELAVKQYDVKIPLYKINEQRNSITVHPSWVLYIKSCLPLIEQYLKSAWIEYLQKNNPNVPAIIYKTEPPIVRHNLIKEHKYWQSYIQENPDELCIYTREKLIEIDRSIDHFLPWSFVCHNRPWNLLPVDRSVNSSKGNNLPALEYYLEPFIELQYSALKFAKSNSKQWGQLSAIFIHDLNLAGAHQLAEESEFSNKLSAVLFNQHALARQMGFSAKWKYC